ncbi:MAG: hypothetical protein K0R61_3121 [Microvirga sp.]|nr:hypothetical protein [Microvirga sp.]
MGEITAKDGPIDRLSTEQRHRVVIASGERHHLASSVLDHEIELSSYKWVVLNDQHPSAFEPRRHAAVFFHLVGLLGYGIHP